MVPVSESFYFPPLQKCLDEGQLLVSWKTVFTSLSRYDRRSRATIHENLENFLNDPFVLQLLTRPYNPYSSTTTQAKSSFETKTAAINVAPNTKRCYSISDVKEDALWLSKEAQIDEMSALRLVILEVQHRPAAQLLSQFAEEEKASLQEAAGNGPEGLSMIPSAAFSSGGFVEFDSQQSRRIRALRLYLSERRYLIKSASLFLQAGLSQIMIEKLPSHEALKEAMNYQKDKCSWVDVIGNKVVESIKKSGKNMQEILLDSIRSLKASFMGLETGSGWFSKDGGHEELEIEWLGNKIVEAVHMMEIIFSILDFQSSIPSSDSVLEWFRFVTTYGFFDEFNSPYPSLQPLIPPLQSLMSIISLVMIEPQRTNEFLNSYPEQNMPPLAGSFYISDLETITELHQILNDAASALSQNASPAVLAWSILLSENRRNSTARRDARELRQSIRAVEEFADDPTDDESGTSSQPLRRRSSFGSDISVEPGVLDKLTESFPLHAEGDIIQHLGAAAVDGCKVFDILTSLSMYFGTFIKSASDAIRGSKIRLVILSLTRLSYMVVDYSPELVTSALAALTGGQQFWNARDHGPLPIEDDPLTNFLGDEWFVDKLLNASISRYPYESLPFLKLMRAVATCKTQHDEGVPLVATMLDGMTSFTFTLPDSFRDYETTQEEDNTNAIQITRPIPLFLAQRMVDGRGFNGKPLALSRPSEDFSIPAGTQGRIISETGPKVSIFFHEYSGLKYLGKLIETGITARVDVDATTGMPVDRESLAEIIGLLADLLLTCSKIKETDSNVNSNAAAHRILEQASDGLGRNRDIVSVVFSIFEEELHNQSNGDINSSLDILISSIHFIFALVPILPGRVWPLMGRSELLEFEDRGGKIASVVGRIELATCRYDFLISCTRLFDALVEDSVANLILRRGGAKSSGRFGTKEDVGTGVSDQVLSKVLLSFTRSMADVFETSCTWKFADEEHRFLLSLHISKVFNNLIQYSYGVGQSFGGKMKLTISLTPSANHIIDMFLSKSSGHLRFRPIFKALLDGFSTPNSTLQAEVDDLWISHVESVVNLITTIIRLGALLERPACQFENQLFRASPLITRLYVVHETYRTPVVKLLQAVVLSVAARSGEPPSLLGYLGATTSKNFIQVLLDLGKPLDDDSDVIATWNLMSTVVSNRQQWFSIYLLTGRPPRATSTDKGFGEQQPPPKTVLGIALDQLSDIKSLSGGKALAMLEFVSLAQNFWPWVMNDLQNQSAFINGISDFVANLDSVSISSGANILDSCYKNRIAAYIAEILAMYVYHSKQVGNTSAAKVIIPKVKFYMRSGTTLSSYNTSLHLNLKRNFESKFEGCSVQDFEKTELESREFGRAYLYDVSFAGKMLHSNQAWTGTAKCRRNDGLAEELAMANVNLSLVDTQVALLHGWKLLAVELSSSGLAANLELQRNVTTTIKDCLITINHSQHSENIFARQNQTRAEFALILMQRLIESKISIPEVQGILPAIWETICVHGSSFESALLSGGMFYYRILLRLLFLAICAHAREESIPPRSNGTGGTPQSVEDILRLSTPTVTLVMSIVENIVAKGFRDAVAAVHEQVTDSVSDDIALLTTLLRTCLRVPGVELCYNQIISYMAASDTPRIATNLFSWSDRLAVDGDPLYGELAVSFLLSLSSIPPMAEQLAVEGILGLLSTAPIIQYMRRANVSPFADSRGLRRCHSIWVRGILPLILNVLSAVGATVAVEIAIFLNQFPNLLKGSVEALEVPPLGASASSSRLIALASLSEVHSLSLITFALTTFRTQLVGVTEVPDVKWDTAGVLESVEQWLTTRISLRGKIVPMSPRETEMRRLRPRNSADGQFESLLEEEVVKELIGIRDVLTGGDGE